MSAKNIRALALCTLVFFASLRAQANTDMHISEPAPSGYTSAHISFDAVAASPDWDRVETINGDKLYPYDSELRSVDLVIFYHGIGYGTQNYVLGNKVHGIGAALASSGFDNHSSDVLDAGVLFLVPKGASKPFSQVEETIRVLEEDRGIHIRSITIGGWSGGAVGLTSALASDIEFRAILYADPSPERRTMAYWPDEPNIDNPGMLINWYRTQNWGSARHPGGWYGNANPKFLRRVQDAGGSAHAVDLNHNEILLLSMVTAVQIASIETNS
ncbi:MAG: hypothetical protein CL930_10250 [Deltaproteobacteria bacterium]|nr:hypothetical protein [Deltaproteobacteria bacterium]